MVRCQSRMNCHLLKRTMPCSAPEGCAVSQLDRDIPRSTYLGCAINWLKRDMPWSTHLWWVICPLDMVIVYSNRKECSVNIQTTKGILSIAVTVSYLSKFKGALAFKWTDIPRWIQQVYSVCLLNSAMLCSNNQKSNVNWTGSYYVFLRNSALLKD